LPRIHTEVMEPQQRGTATLLAEARELDTAAGDDALDLLEHAPGRPARPRRPGGTRERLRVLPGLDLAGHGSSTALSKYCSTRRPAACRWGGHDRRHGVPRAGRRRRVGRPALLNNQGVATGSWGATNSRNDIYRGIGS
jgi:hypothetical protein